MAEERQETPNEETEAKKSTVLNEFISHQRKAAEEAYKAVEALIPPDFRTHSRTARDEFVESFRVLVGGVADVVDKELEKMRATASETGRPSTTGKSKVKVEVS